MKPIKSDKSGRNIHSPFIYRLVANVLFSPYPFYAFTEIELISKNNQESKNLQLIFRLINHFQFDQVYMLEIQDQNIKKISRMAKSDIQINSSENIKYEDKIANRNEYKRLVIINNSEKILNKNLYPKTPEIWVLLDIKDLKTKECFTMLKTQKEVQVTIELNQLGIVIFNEIFEKQNYVIKH
ncbi:MAG: hypothetical protein HQ541_01490 [Mariniphaga sp.]|nr:hypothetical protein [Mariniphaga sp.]